MLGRIRSLLILLSLFYIGSVYTEDYAAINIEQFNETKQFLSTYTPPGACLSSECRPNSHNYYALTRPDVRITIRELSFKEFYELRGVGTCVQSGAAIPSTLIYDDLSQVKEYQPFALVKCVNDLRMAAFDYEEHSLTIVAAAAEPTEPIVISILAAGDIDVDNLDSGVPYSITAADINGNAVAIESFSLANAAQYQASVAFARTEETRTSPTESVDDYDECSSTGTYGKYAPGFVPGAVSGGLQSYSMPYNTSGYALVSGSLYQSLTSLDDYILNLPHRPIRGKLRFVKAAVNALIRQYALENKLENTIKTANQTVDEIVITETEVEEVVTYPPDLGQGGDVVVEGDLLPQMFPGDVTLIPYQAGMPDSLPTGVYYSNRKYTVSGDQVRIEPADPIS